MNAPPDPTITAHAVRRMLAASDWCPRRIANAVHLAHGFPPSPPATGPTPIHDALAAEIGDPL